MTATTTRPRAGWFARLISRTAKHPSGSFGRLLGWIWWRETAPINDHALQLLDVQPGEHVLELGFGPGRTVRRLVQAGARVTGVEVSTHMIRLAARRNRTAVRAGTATLHQGDGTDLPIGDSRVDAAVSVHTIYFWSDHAAVAAELGRVLRPGGRLVLGMRDPALPLTDRSDPDVYQRVGLHRLAGLLEAAGLDKVCVVRNPNIARDAVWIVATRTGETAA